MLRQHSRAFLLAGVSNSRIRHLCHAKPPTNTPTFWREDSLSCIDNGQYRLFTAQSGPRFDGETRHYFANPRTTLGERSDGIPETRSGQIIGEFWIERSPVNHS